MEIKSVFVEGKKEGKKGGDIRAFKRPSKEKEHGRLTGVEIRSKV